MSELVQRTCQVLVYGDDGTVALWGNDMEYLAENEPNSVEKVRRCGKTAYGPVCVSETFDQVWMCFDHYFQYTETTN